MAKTSGLRAPCFPDISPLPYLTTAGRGKYHELENCDEDIRSFGLCNDLISQIFNANQAVIG